MTLEEKLKLFKDKGFTYDPETGIIVSYTGKILDNLDILGYNVISVRYNKKTISIKGHRFAWYMYYNEVPKIIDHINRIKSDNRICNLRNVSQSKNLFNTNAKGYSYDKKNKKYVAAIRLNYKPIYLGQYNTCDDAHQAYLDAKKIYHII